MLDILKQHFELLGRVPSYNDFVVYKLKPNFNLYAKKFGTYHNACFKAGIIDEYIDEDIKKEKTIEEIKILAYQLQRIPTVEEYENYKIYGYCHSKFNIKFGKSYVNLCKEILPEYSMSKKITLVEVELVIRDYYNKYNKSPFLKDIGFHTKLFKNRSFSITYKQFLKQLDLPLPKYYSDDELLDMFYVLYNKLQYIPTTSDITNASDLPHWGTYQDRFGSLKNICDLLDIEFHLFRGIGNIRINKKGEICQC